MKLPESVKPKLRSTPAAPPFNRAKGWKLDPHNDQRIRWWDGRRWGSAVADAGDDAETYAAAELGENVELPEPPNVGPTTRAASPDPDSKITSAGWTTAFLIPIVGFFVGVVVLTRGRTEGIGIMVTAVIMAVVWFYVLSDLMVVSG
ncbi:MAG: DUF2510 domain-containing protein [Solirubrobacterales bacterium]|nr:DUF2510 domain-containing protein [Solirubrobacterales bacterium]